MDWSFLHRDTSSLARVLSQPGLETSFLYGGTMFKGVRTALKREAVNTDAGLAGEYSFSLLCLAAQFRGSFPEARTSTIEMDGKGFRVLSLDFDAAASTVRLNLGDILA